MNYNTLSLFLDPTLVQLYIPLSNWICSFFVSLLKTRLLNKFVNIQSEQIFLFYMCSSEEEPHLTVSKEVHLQQDRHFLQKICMTQTITRGKFIWNILVKTPYTGVKTDWALLKRCASAGHHARDAQLRCRHCIQPISKSSVSWKHNSLVNSYKRCCQHILTIKRVLKGCVPTVWNWVETKPFTSLPYFTSNAPQWQ